MANDKRFIVKNGLRADNVEFTDSQDGSNQITLNMLNTDTLNFEGDAGSLFSISDDLTGTVFSVGDISGIPIIEANGDTHNVTFNEFDGKVMIGGTDSGSTDSDVLNVTGNVRATAYYGDGSNLSGISAGGTDSATVSAIITADVDNAFVDALNVNAATVTSTANNTTNETVYLTFVDGATGEQGIETDTSLFYNPSTNIISIGNDTDNYGIIGRARMGFTGFSDYAGFAHIDNATTTNYALLHQNNGSTYLNAASGGSIAFRNNNVNVAVMNANTLEMQDNKDLALGTSSDLSLVHDGSNSYINQTGTGNLYIRQNSTNNISLTDNATYLYYAGNSRLQTTSAGITVTGTASATTFSGSGASLTSLPAGQLTGTIDSARLPVIASANDAGTLDGINSTSFLRSDAADTKTSGTLSFSDTVTLDFGAGVDLRLRSNGTNGYIEQTSGNSIVYKSGGHSFRNAADTEQLAKFTENSAVELYHDNSKKFETTSTGATVTGTLVADGVDLGDSEELRIGTSQDLRLYHDGTNSYITHNNIVTSSLIIQNINTDNNSTDGIRIETIDNTASGLDNYVHLPNNAGVVLGASGVDKVSVLGSGSFFNHDIILNSPSYELKFRDGSYYTILDAVISGSQDHTVTLPAATGTVPVFTTAPTGAIADGTNGQVLTTNGSGGLSFTTVSGGGGLDSADVLTVSGLTSGFREYQGGTTFDPAGGGTGTDTATDVGVALTSGTRIVGTDNGYIRTLLEWNASNTLNIGQSGTTLIQHVRIFGGTQGVELYENGTKRLETTPTGATVTGELVADSASFSGPIHVDNDGTDGPGSGIRVANTEFYDFGSGDPTFRNVTSNTKTVLRVLPNGTGMSGGFPANQSSAFEFFGKDYHTDATTYHNFRILGREDSDYIIDTSHGTSSPTNKGIRFNLGSKGGSYSAENILVLSGDSDGGTMGNVGIGTATPATKLDVNGIITATAVQDATYLSTVSGSSTSKIRLWDETNTSQYVIGMSDGYTFGGLNNDYAINFTMSNTNSRGFIFDDNGHGSNSGAMAITTDGKVTVAHSIRVGYGETDTTTPGATHTLDVNGSFAATTKSFVIDHPTKEGKRLRYGSLEGPENGVYVRGRLKGDNRIQLPDYWTGLVDEDTITVNLTPIGNQQSLFVEDIADNQILIGGCRKHVDAWDINCFYTVYGERKDVDQLVVEYDA
jgi:hypothetical protein